MIALALLLSFVVALGLGLPVRRLLHRLTMIDHPTERSSHSVPTLRGGGLAPAVAILITVIALQYWPLIPLLLCAVVFGAIGFMDDVRSLSVRSRIFLQLITATCTAAWIFHGVGNWLTFGVIVAAVVVFVIACVNAVNFMDGINGISSVWCITSGVMWAAVGAAFDVPTLTIGGVVLTGASAGFLPFNFPNARLFLGDVGSYFLGAWSAVLIVWGVRSGIPPVLMLAPIVVYAFDTSLTVVRRLLGGRPVLQAHREHVYQRLVQAGWSHAQTSIAVAVTSLLCTLAATGILAGGVVAVAGGVFFGLLMCAYGSAPMFVARHEAPLTARSAFPHLLFNVDDKTHVNSDVSSSRKAVLVTGGAGFVGVPVVRQLLTAGERVVVLDNYSTGAAERLLSMAQHERLRIIEGDIRSSGTLERVFSAENIDAVVHLAALHFIPFCLAHPSQTLDVNVTGTQALLDAADKRNIRKIVFASTADVYAPSEFPHHETDATVPNNIYGASKLMAEQLLRLFAAGNPATEVVVARLFNVYGPGETNPHLLPDILDGLRQSDVLDLGNMTSKRDYIFTEDLARMLANLTRKSTAPWTTVNLGSGKSWTAAELIEILASITGRAVTVKQNPHKMRPIDRPHLCASVTTLRTTHPDASWTPMETGLRETLASVGLL